MGDGHIFAETAHRGVVVGVYGMDEGTCTEEEERLEHGVCEQVEHGGHVSEAVVEFGTCHAKRYHHKGNLRDSREREHTFNIDLAASHYGGIESRDGADTGDKQQRCFLNKVEREHAGNQINAGNHHGSSVDEGRNRCRAFHSVRKPDVQRHHGRLTHTADEDEHEGPSQHRSSHEGCAACRSQHAGRIVGDGYEVECLAVEGKYQDTDEETEVGETRHDERLLGSRYGRRQLIIEADEQVRGDAHELPEYVHLENVGCHHEAEHREREQRKESVETLESLLPFHVAPAVEVHHE